MTDRNAVHDDISFLRALAEDGRDAPLNSGPPLLSAGTIFGLASAVAVWGGSTDQIAEAWVYAALFLGAGAAHGAVMWRISRSPQTRLGAGSRTNVATNLAWTAIGWSILATTGALIAIGLSTHDWRVMLGLQPMVLCAYGAAWIVAAFMSRQRWLWLVALASFAIAIGMGAVAGSGVAFYGLFVAAVFLLVALPGLVLTLQARRAL
jgi:hypothetical protein